MTIGFCAPDLGLLQLQVERDCTNRQKHFNDGPQWVWLRIHNASGLSQERYLVISPYFHSRIDVYQQDQGAWTLSLTGGAELGGHTISASLGGHRFAIDVPPGDSQWLLTVQSHSTKVPHIGIDLEDRRRPFSSEQLWLALHIGMLLMMFLLVLVGWLIERTQLQLRLLVMILLASVSVLIGSGALHLLWPDASPHWWGGVVFNVSNVLRLTCLAWIYEWMIRPFQHKPLYRRLHRQLYSLSGFVALLFVADQFQMGWLLTMLVLVLALAIPAYGLYTAVAMPPRLKRILQGYLLLLLLLCLGSLLSIALASGHGNFPVYISRIIDLSWPLGMMATILLRNQVMEREYQRTKAVLDAQSVALESERQSRQEKRMLLDMLTHEIKNPLASISFAITTLSQSQEGRQGQTPRRLENISRSVETIDQIIERCNLANGIEDERITPSLEAMDLTQMLSELITSSSQAARLAMPSGTVAHVMTDPYLLRVIAANLIDNALKYALPDSRILVEPFFDMTAHPRRWGIRFSNAVASNMVPDPKQLFQRYYRHPLAQQLRGSGLGLSICRQICELLGGQINHQAQDGHIMFEVHFETE